VEAVGDVITSESAPPLFDANLYLTVDESTELKIAPAADVSEVFNNK
jgi:hypothetical protein